VVNAAGGTRLNFGPATIFFMMTRTAAITPRRAGSLRHAHTVLLKQVQDLSLLLFGLR
jgi:hypothetical protein